MSRSPKEILRDTNVHPPVGRLMDYDELRKPRFSETDFATQEQRALAAGVPRRYLDSTLDNFETTRAKGQGAALKIAFDYVKHFDAHRRTGRGLIFTGEIGTGKTRLASAIALQLLRARYRVRMARTWAVINDIRENTYGNQGSGRQVVAAYKKPDLLILEEVGVQRGTEDEMLLLYDVIEARYSDLKPTLLISNQPIDKLHEYLGERSLERIVENSQLVVFDWESYRTLAE